MCVFGIDWHSFKECEFRFKYFNVIDGDNIDGKICEI